jgi:Bacterial protein of unknown function (Gcw_chp)
MKKLTVAAFAAFALSVGSAAAADLPVKAKPIVAPEPPAWDFAFGSAIASDYVFRGITQSNHSPSVAVYFEPRYNITKDLQAYVGLGGASIDFPNRAAGEVDIYGGIRPTFDKLSLDFGGWYYWYPRGQCFNTPVTTGGTPLAGCIAPLPNTNTIKKDLSFFEAYAKFNYAVTDALSVGGNFYYSPSFLNSGAPGEYVSGTAKYTFTALSNGVGPYISGEFGRQFLGTTDTFYGTATFPGGINYADYNTWNAGFGWTYKVFTVDLRYSDTNLSRGNCNAFTGDFSAGGSSAVTPINPSGVGSNWCGATFIARLSADLTVNTNVK